LPSTNHLVICTNRLLKNGDLINEKREPKNPSLLPAQSSGIRRQRPSAASCTALRGIPVSLGHKTI
jgi:hypothetical protein